MIKHLEEIDSTSKYMMEHPEEFDNLDVLSASHQTNGVGRTGNTWIDEEGENILFSIMIKDKKIIDSYKLLSISLGTYILGYLKGHISEDRISLKWPNDVYVNEKKICGILLQGRLPNYVVVGIGINVNQRSFGDIEATSLSLELNREIDVENIRNSLIKYVVNRLEDYEKNKDICVEVFNNHNYLKNREITYFDVASNTTKEGLALDINGEGDLLISTDHQIIPVSASEIRKIR